MLGSFGEAWEKKKVFRLTGWGPAGRRPSWWWTCRCPPSPPSGRRPPGGWWTPWWCPPPRPRRWSTGSRTRWWGPAGWSTWRPGRPVPTSGCRGSRRVGQSVSRFLFRSWRRFPEVTGRRERVRRKSTQTGTLGPFSRSLPDVFFPVVVKTLSSRRKRLTHSLTQSDSQSSWIIIITFIGWKDWMFSLNDFINCVFEAKPKEFFNWLLLYFFFLEETELDVVLKQLCRPPPPGWGQPLGPLLLKTSMMTSRLGCVGRTTLAEFLGVSFLPLALFHPGCCQQSWCYARFSLLGFCFHKIEIKLEFHLSHRLLNSSVRDIWQRCLKKWIISFHDCKYGSFVLYHLYSRSS